MSNGTDDQINNFLDDCKKEIEKISILIENADFRNYDPVIEKIGDEIEIFINSLQKREKELERYEKNEELFRADFYELAKQNKLAMDYYNLTQKLKLKNEKMKFSEEYLPFIFKNNFLKKLLKSYFYTKYAESLSFDFNGQDENSCFHNFMTLFKAYFFMGVDNKRRFEKNGLKIFQGILNLFEAKFKYKDPQFLNNNHFYSLLKSLIEKNYSEDKKLSRSEKSQINKHVILKTMILDLLNIQEKKNFGDLKKIISDPEIDAKIKVNAEKEVETWKLKIDEDFKPILMVRKMMKYALLQENTNEETIKEAKKMADQIDSLIEKMEKFEEEFKQDSFYKIIKSWKNKTQSRRFTKQEILDLFNNLNKLVTEKKIKALKEKDKNIAFEFLNNVVDVLSNIKDEEVDKIYVKNFTAHLKNIKALFCILKDDIIDSEEYYLLINRRINNLNIRDFSYSFSEKVHHSLNNWINYLY